MYRNIKQKIPLMNHISGSSKTKVKNLMNLVMQFRKVCNHPEIFQRKQPISPLYLQFQ